MLAQSKPCVLPVTPCLRQWNRVEGDLPVRLGAIAHEKSSFSVLWINIKESITVTVSFALGVILWHSSILECHRIAPIAK